MDNEQHENCVNHTDKVTDNITIKSDEEINRLIIETEDTLAALMQELKRRQADHQHDDIDHLEDHLNQADTSLKVIREFISMALHEIRGKK